VNIPTTEPDAFVAGDSVKWTKRISGYDPADGWVLSYAFVKDGDQQVIASTDNGDGAHLITLTPALSAAFKEGIYHWQSTLADGTDRYQVTEGRIDVKPDFLNKSNGFDSRSHVKKVLDALNAVIEKKASKDQESITVGDKSIKRLTPSELLKWRSFYQREYTVELQKQRIANGDAPGNKIRVRFINGR